DPAASLKTVKERLRAVPQRGLGYGLLRYACPDPTVRASLTAAPQAQISFNYLGQFDQSYGSEALFHPADGVIGPLQSPRQRLHHLIEINGAVTGGQLRFVWTYSGPAFSASTVRRLADRYCEELQALIARSQLGEARDVSPADFPQARVSQRDLDAFLAQLSPGNRSS
ncbi:MAG TPA: condensation domain-containing protein, partial [Chloroflexota bacterium]|nr:condensation domain-containing protein [Chloroflexota bacterium]